MPNVNLLATNRKRRRSNDEAKAYTFRENRKRERRRWKKRVTSIMSSNENTLHTTATNVAWAAAATGSGTKCTNYVSHFDSVAAATALYLCFVLSIELSPSLTYYVCLCVCLCRFDNCIRIQSWRVEFLVWKLDVRFVLKDLYLDLSLSVSIVRSLYKTIWSILIMNFWAIDFFSKDLDICAPNTH